MVHAGVSELRAAFWDHGRRTPGATATASDHLLLFYRAECGIKMVWLRWQALRLLKEAAARSLEEKDEKWQDRFLAPSAMRGALEACSSEKISEVRIENKALAAIFDKLLSLDKSRRHIPFSRDELGLSGDEMTWLEQNGVILGDGGQYYMPEIFRHGLDFDVSTRPRVMALARRARRGGL